MKLYHWSVKLYSEPGVARVFNFLTMAEDMQAARKVLIMQTAFAPVLEEDLPRLVAALEGPPTFVADALYPIVIW